MIRAWVYGTAHEVVKQSPAKASGCTDVETRCGIVARVKNHVIAPCDRQVQVHCEECKRLRLVWASSVTE